MSITPSRWLTSTTNFTFHILSPHRERLPMDAVEVDYYIYLNKELQFSIVSTICICS